METAYNIINKITCLLIDLNKICEENGLELTVKIKSKK